MNAAPAKSVWIRRLSGALMLGIAVVTVLASIQAHRKAGFTLPTPWNDEPWLLWSSIALAEHNTFYSESLHPDRVVPREPVYQVPLALLFKLTGFSYAEARWVSWFYLMLAYAGIWMLAKSRPLPLLSAGTASLFFLGASAVVAGNMARQESMVWALAIWSCVLADRGHAWKALSLAGLAALAGQVGIVFLAGGIFLFLLHAWEARGKIRPTKGDGAVMGLALAVLLGQIAFVWANWSALLSDWGGAYHEPFQQNFLVRFFLSNKTPWLAAYAGLAGLGLFWRRARPLRIPAVLGICALSAMLLRPQMWYELYNQMAFMLLALSIPWALYLLAGWLLDASGSGTGPAWLRHGLLLLAFAVGWLPMLRMCYAHGFITGPRNYPEKLGWGWGMRMDPAPYLTAQDVQAVVREIEKHVADGQPHRVFFMPEGDGLFFHGKLPTNAIPYQGVRTRVLGDMAVFRFSRHPPAWWTEQHVKKYLRIYGGEGLAPFYERDGTESWILVPPGRERPGS